MDEQQTKEQIFNHVMEFATKMNHLENKFASINKKNPGTVSFEDFNNEYAEIFTPYCTEKKRAYGGQGVCFGIPTKYDRVENYIERSIELKNKNRAEVYFKTNNNFNAEYLFIVLRKEDEWKIDSYKERRFNGEKWTNKLL
jgi:hypothetical protein